MRKLVFVLQESAVISSKLFDNAVQILISLFKNLSTLRGLTFGVRSFSRHLLNILY